MADRPETTEKLDFVMGQLDRIGRATRSMLGFFRQRAAYSKPVSCAEVIRATTDLFDPSFAAKGVQVIVNLPYSLPGVSVKSLGYFHERGPAIQLIRLDPDASTPPGETGAFMIRYVYEGEVEYRGKLCRAVTDMYYSPDAPYEGLTSRTGATILSIELQAQLPGSEPPLPFRI